MSDSSSASLVGSSWVILRFPSSETGTKKYVHRYSGSCSSRWAVSWAPMSRSPATWIIAFLSAEAAWSVSWRRSTQSFSMPVAGLDLGSDFDTYFAMYRAQTSTSTTTWRSTLAHQSCSIIRVWELRRLSFLLVERMALIFSLTSSNST